jgi:GNAT superfamily N-acetyltransferase
MSPTNPSRPSRRRSRGSAKSPSPARIRALPSERLSGDHDVGEFVSGVSSLDDWLGRVALNSDAAGNTRTWVWAPDGTTVVAYYSLGPTLLRQKEVPKTMSRGTLSATPSILLARLAIAQSLQGRGLGAALLGDALARALRAVEIIGGRFIVVDAIDEDAIGFYEHHGFLRTPNNPNRLVIKASRVSVSF